ncbi:TPR-like protein [Lentinula aciculospora]|uniref:TPR-like protein n=1 Tax=Lentinula aciculospora TaxID=153920 RepID=A0A9W9ALV5_9AGAR|nr:TPR-like protein [Lentinula aciculospora]
MSSSLRHHRDVRMLDPPSTSTNGAPLVSPAMPPASSTTNGPLPPSTIIQKLNSANEQTWLLIGRVAEQMGDLEHALSAYENALRHNPMSLSGLTQVAGIARIKENYPKAIEFFQRVLNLQDDNGEVWSALGHCYLMQDDLQKAYAAYQQALYLLPSPKDDPKLWYGIGILYDRYGSLDHAEEAFSSVLAMDKDLDFDKANEILFRLGIIYKQQGKYEDSLACFDRILRNPPSPLAHADIWFQIGHVYEQQKDHVKAKDAYERVVADNPVHAKVLQQLGWLYHQDGSSFQNQELAIQYLTKSLEADSSDAQSWYLLGRAYMAGQKYNKAYEAYQQAVYRDGRNPTFWCSIGVLYFQINQFRDALDAYSRAIRINPYISEVWFDLGSLYESCNNQISDAIDAYARASELDPHNVVISGRLQLLRTAQATGGQLPAAPGPQDVHPTAYASAVVPPPGLTGPPLLLQPPNQRTSFRAESRNTPNEISLPPPSQASTTRSPPGPFRGGPPPPVNIDESRHASLHTPLAPIELDAPVAHSRDFLPSRETSSRAGPQSSLLLHHLNPSPADDIRARGPHGDYFPRHRAPSSRSSSPPPLPAVRTRSSPPPPPYSGFTPSTRAVGGPGQPMPTRSPRTYPSQPPGRSEPDIPWDRRAGERWEPAPDRRSARHSNDYPPPSPFYPPRSPGHHSHRGNSPPEPSPRSSRPPSRYWDSVGNGKPTSSYPGNANTPPPPGSHDQDRIVPRSRFDPTREHDVRGASGHASRVAPLPPITRSESPHPANDKEKRRRAPASREPEPIPMIVDNGPKKDKEKKKRTSTKRKDDGYATGSASGGYKSAHGYAKGGSPGPVSSNGSGSSNRPSPTSALTPRPPSRVVDEDYDEGVADALMGLAAYRPPTESAPSESHSHSPSISSGSRHSDSHPTVSHRDSISSNRSHMSPPPQPMALKRALSPTPDDSNDSKRSRMDGVKRRASSPSNGKRTPVPSTRPSPIPFRTQPTSHSPDSARHETYPASPPLPAVLPPHPRPIGAGAGAGITNSSNSSASIALPPIATLSPTSSAPSPGAGNDERERERDRDRMQVDSRPSLSPPRSKLAETPSRSPPKHTPSPGSSGVEKKESA